MQIRHKVNKGIAEIDDATGELLIESEKSTWERFEPAPEPKPAPVKKVPS